MPLITTLYRGGAKRNTPALAKAAKMLGMPVALTCSQEAPTVSAVEAGYRGQAVLDVSGSSVALSEEAV